MSAPQRTRRVFVGAVVAACLPCALVAGTTPARAADAPRPNALSANRPIVVGYTARTAHGGLTVGSVLAGNPAQANLVAHALSAMPGVTAANVAVSFRRTAEPAVPSISGASARQLTGSSDPRLGTQWGLRTLSYAEDWRWSQGAGVTVAVIDDGVDRSHPDLAGMVYPGINIANSNRPADAGEHGTHVAGVIAARAGNRIGGSGLAPRARILPVDVFDGDSTDDVTVAQGIVWAVGGHINGRPDNTHPARVINLSLGGSDSSAILRQATAYAQARGAVVIAAAGNSGPDSMSYPAGYQGVVGVGAMDSDFTVADWSSTGPQVDVVAPGVGIVSTTCVTYAAAPASWRLSTTAVSRTPNDCARSPITRDYVATYEAMSGTSMATPFVSASAALLISRFPTWSAAQVAGELQRTARDLGTPGRDDAYGRGLVQPVIDLRGAPGAPTSVAVSSVPTVTPTNPTPSAVITWSAVTYAGSYGLGGWRVQLSTDGGAHWSAVHAVPATAPRIFTFRGVPLSTALKARVSSVARLTGAIGAARDSGVVWHGVDAGNTLDTAVGPLSPGASAREVLGNNGGGAPDADWFRVAATPGTPPASFHVDVTSAPLGSVVSVFAIHDIAGVPTTDGAATTSGPAGQTLLVNPSLVSDTPGDYVVVVTGPGSGASPYTVSIS